MITGFGGVREAVEVTRQGAEGFITKPFQFDELMHEWATASEKRRLKSKCLPARCSQDRSKLDGIIGRAPIMLQLFELIRTVAATASTVLITGETGTGKELAARAIHDASPGNRSGLSRSIAVRFPKRCSKPRFFGHVRGAFTGAIASRAGSEQANRGTLLLDEMAR